MYNNTWIHLWPTKAHQGYKHTPQTSTVALSLTAISKGANFRSVKNKTSSKRLFYICIFPTSLTSLRKYRRGKRDKDSNLINRTKIYSAIFSDVSLNVSWCRNWKTESWCNNNRALFIFWSFYSSIHPTISCESGLVVEPIEATHLPFSSIRNLWKFHPILASETPFSLLCVSHW